MNDAGTMQERTAGRSAILTGLRCGAAMWLVLASSSCIAPQPPRVVTDPDPSVKIPAIQKAVHEKDRTALPQLVKDLDNDDAAIRFYANRALEQLSGVSFGYRFFDDADQREPAARKWRQWLEDASGGHPKAVPAATQATSGPS